MNLWRDIRFGFRLWRKNYGFAAVAALTLALGIGATTAIFSVIYATLFEPLPYHEPEQIVVLWSKVQGGHNVTSAGDFLEWARQNTTFQAMSTSTGASFNLAMPDPTVPPEFGTFAGIVSASVQTRRFNLVLVGFFAVTALFLAVVGLYGVMAYAVTRRTSEIGVRMALGATPANILRLVLSQGARVTVVGVLIGIVGSLGLTRAIRSLLFGLSPTDPLTFAAVAVLLVAVALLACWIPARRAARVDPIVALRYE